MIKVSTMDILHRQASRYRCDECGGGPTDRMASGGGLDYRPFSIITGTIGDEETGVMFCVTLCSACVDELMDHLDRANRAIGQMDQSDRVQYERRVRSKQDRDRAKASGNTVIRVAGTGDARKTVLMGGRDPSVRDPGVSRRTKPSKGSKP